jgi:hypothetical protein
MAAQALDLSFGAGDRCGHRCSPGVGNLLRAYAHYKIVHMHVKSSGRPDAYAASTVGLVVSKAKETHTTNRVVRLGDEWDELGAVAGVRKRAEVIRQLVRWYLRYPGVKLPERPPRKTDVG